MKLSFVLIIYRYDSSVAKESSIFCENALKDRNIKSQRIESNFDEIKIENYFCNLRNPSKGWGLHRPLGQPEPPWGLTPQLVNPPRGVNPLVVNPPGGLTHWGLTPLKIKNYY